MEECSDEQHNSRTKEAKSTKIVKLWSEEDEITLLSGFYEYGEKIGKYDDAGFYEFIQHRLIRFSANQSQVSDKICCLRKKYAKNASKLGSDKPHVVDPHLEKLLELSAKIWGIEGEDYSNNIIHENICRPSSPLSSVNVKFDLSNKLLDEEFLDFLYDEGVDVDLLEDETKTNLKKNFGEVELCRSKFEYKDAKLMERLQQLKYDHYKNVAEKLKFFQ